MKYFIEASRKSLMRQAVYNALDEQLKLGDTILMRDNVGSNKYVIEYANEHGIKYTIIPMNANEFVLQTLFIEKYFLIFSFLDEVKFSLPLIMISQNERMRNKLIYKIL